MVLKVGNSAPDFKLLTDTNELISLTHFSGKKIILYFYPKDDTPGCTLEAQNFSQYAEEFKLKNAIIIGISKDSVDSHCHFKSKYKINVILASDKDNDVCELYGVWKEKSLYGKKFMGIERATFLIDEDRKIQKIWNNVKVENHVHEVLSAVST